MLPGCVFLREVHPARQRAALGKLGHRFEIGPLPVDLGLADTLLQRFTVGFERAQPATGIARHARGAHLGLDERSPTAAINRSLNPVGTN